MERLPILRAAQSSSPAIAAQHYANLGYSVLPMRGKHPNLPTWKAYQKKPAGLDTIRQWEREERFQNVGLVCGAVSGGLVVVDLDGEGAYQMFSQNFPDLLKTYTVKSGGGEGWHLYYQLQPDLTPTTRVTGLPQGNIELRSEGLVVVAVPSQHPETGYPYQVIKPVAVSPIFNLNRLAAWIKDLRKPLQHPARGRGKRGGGTSTDLSPDLIADLISTFEGRGYQKKGDWLSGSCIYPERHRHRDRKPSFGFNTVSAYGNCYVCGSMRAIDIARQVGIDPRRYLKD